MGVDLLFLSFVANDYLSQTATATYTTQYEGAADFIKAICPYISVLPARISDNNVIPQSDYEAIVKAKAIADGYAWISVNDAWGGSYVAANMSDNVHPDIDGHNDIKDIIESLLYKINL